MYNVSISLITLYILPYYGLFLLCSLSLFIQILISRYYPRLLIFLCNISRSSSLPIGTSVSIGQTSFFDDLHTWSALPTPPLLLVWGAAAQDPRGETFLVNNQKIKKALNQMFATTQSAVGISNQITINQKAAVSKMFSQIPASDIQLLLRLDDITV